MEKATIRSLLIDFNADIGLNEATLVQIHNHLFETEYFIPEGLAQDLIDHLVFLKQLIEKHEFSEPAELIAYFDAKKRRFAKFFDQALEEHDRAEAIEATSKTGVKSKHYGLYSHGSFETETVIRSLTWLSPNKRTFNEYLSDLMDYFRTVYSDTLRNKLSHYERYDIRLKDEHIRTCDFIEGARDICEDKYFKLYLQGFTVNRNSQPLHLLKSIKPLSNVCQDQNTFLEFDMYTSYTMTPLLENNEGVDLERSMESYQRILEIISREQLITEQDVKTDLANFIYRSKFHRRRDNYNCTFFDIKLRFGANLELNRHRNNFGHIRSFINGITKMKLWKVLKSPEGRSWVTTDNPGIAINLNDLSEFKSILPDVSLSNIREDTMIYFPISSKYCLRIQPVLNQDLYNQDVIEAPIEMEKSSFDEVELVNGLMLGARNEVVIAKDKKELSKFKMS